MSGFLFRQVVFGPVRSRRFGVSLGINLLPIGYKLCSYNCIYCECGITQCAQPQDPLDFIPAKSIAEIMHSRFAEILATGPMPDNLTFAGNGEPTMHPEFPAIMEETIRLRNTFFPGTKITVLSNATRAGDPAILNALLKADNNVLKLDVGTPELLASINRPLVKISLPQLVGNLKNFDGKLTVQSLFLKGVINGRQVNNSKGEQFEQWLKHLEDIHPALVMVYSIDRATPVDGLERLSHAELREISERIKSLGLKAEIF